MVMRIRPYWEELKSILMPSIPTDPDQPPVRQRRKFDVSVCTAAQRSYALEAWRLLDPSGSLISDVGGFELIDLDP